MFKYIIWDFDGTLYNTYPGLARSYLAVLKDKYGLDFEYKKVFNWCKESLSTCAKNLAKELNIDKDELRSNFTKYYKEKGAPVEEPPFHGAREICKKIIDNGRANLILTHRDYDTLIRLLEKYNMRGYFIELVTSTDNFPRKPDPSSLNYLLEKYKVSKDEALLVGDRDLDIQAARNAGIKSCYFDPNGNKHPNSDYQIKSLFELEKIIF
ncbi:HAD-IA family hydrolase [Thermohalobacter berrensis]|uniref:Haloacid dehalogenase n=1 Tax=Thermohalobacter berrensis TaxID=99594 RepID=A0A419SXY4_9FIRM|nr:HAD-IA family hydrolase [Thermohalobacter berrensis]RKD30019.1 hypothetical protein BET03_04760 [Thermohalobacter berrensis]